MEYSAHMLFFTRRKKEEKSELFKVDLKAKKIEGLETLKASRLASLAIDRCTEIFNSTGARPAGSEEGAKAASMLLSAFNASSDGAHADTFSADTSSYWAVFRILPAASVAMLVLCLVGFPSISLVLAVLSVIFCLKSFLLCNEVRGTLKKKELVNVWATIEPEGDVEETVCFTSHHDSAPMFRQVEGIFGSLVFSVYLPIVHFIVLSLSSLVLFVTEIFTGELLSFNLPPLSMLILLILLLLSFPVYLKMFTLVTKDHSPGVGDNLISGCILTELAHYFWWKKSNGRGLKNTRLVFASFDGEECGLVGSREWYREHEDILANARVINLDCPLRCSDFTFLTKDVNGFQPLSSSLASLCSQSAKSMGYEVKVGSLSVLSGATDAASAARSGHEATTLMGIPLSGAGSGVIHTPDDNLSVLDRRAVEEAISICIKIVEQNFSASETKAEPKPLSLADEGRKFTLR